MDPHLCPGADSLWPLQVTEGCSHTPVSEGLHAILQYAIKASVDAMIIDDQISIRRLFFFVFLLLFFLKKKEKLCQLHWKIGERLKRGMSPLWHLLVSNLEHIKPITCTWWERTEQFPQHFCFVHTKIIQRAQGWGGHSGWCISSCPPL